ncbi:hypothetical protein [uncultured Methylobacterium sp.]|uniref:hypothetical protein n=1 Tax=uncultured Methylobacterium sp. TaxID=157278 RepID=UPI0035C9E40F
MTRVSEQALLQALAMSDDGGGEPFQLVAPTDDNPGMEVTFRPASSGDYLMFVIRRIKGERQRFLRATRNGVEEGRAQAKADREAEEHGVKVKSAKQVEAEREAVEQAAVEETMAHVENQIDSGPESMAALCAVCAGFPGNEAVEKRFARSPKLLAMHEIAHRLTHEQPDFSDAVSALIWGATAAKTSSDAS